MSKGIVAGFAILSLALTPTTTGSRAAQKGNSTRRAEPWTERT